MSSRYFKKTQPTTEFTGRCGSDTASLPLFVIHSSHRQSILISIPFVYSRLHHPVCKCLHNIAIAGLKKLHREEIPDPDDDKFLL